MQATAIATDAPGIRDEHRRDMVGRRIEYADPLVPRGRTPGISERVFADGNVDRRVDPAEIDIFARHSMGANVDPVAVCLLDACVDGVPKSGTVRERTRHEAGVSRSTFPRKSPVGNPP